jgi:hypothetical protein
MDEWTAERKLDAAIRAPLHPGHPRAKSSRVVRRPDWHQVHTPDAPGSGLNEIAFSRVREEDAERVIDEAIATYHATGHPVKWCVGPWTKPDDFAERLERRGFTSWHVRGMGCATDLALRPVPAVDVIEVGLDTLDEWEATNAEGWSVQGGRALFREVSLDALTANPRHAHLFGARIDGKMVGTAGLVEQEGFGYLVGGVVLERLRGRGVYRALVAARLAFLRARGHGYAVTHAREATSAPILERMGMETIFRSRCFVLEPPSQ